jgi:6-phosphogluconolactonase
MSTTPPGGPAPRVEVHGSADELATTVAGAFLRLLTVRQAAGDVPLVALTGGTIADRIHREIARLAPGSDVDWSRVEFFWGDERFVAHDSDERNATQARAAFLDSVAAHPARVHEVPSTSEAASVDAAATSYADTLRSVGRSVGSGSFDLLMLGVGPDGHVASLFPGFPQLAVDDEIVVGVTGSPKPPPERVTLTFPALNHSEEVWFVVSGADKAEAVGRALAADPPGVQEIPATGVRGRTATIWFLDRDAASAVS